MVLPKRYVHPEPQNMTLFGIKVFADVIRVMILRCGHPGLRWTLRTMTSVLVRARRGEDTHTEEKAR